MKKLCLSVILSFISLNAENNETSISKYIEQDWGIGAVTGQPFPMQQKIV